MNIGSYVARAARFFGDRVAVVEGPRSLSFNELEERTNRLAHALTGIGIKAGDRVAVALPNSTEWIEADYAVVKAGAMSVPVSPKLHDQEILRMIGAVRSSLLIANEEVLGRLAKSGATPDIPVISVDGPSGLDYAALIADASSDPICVEVDDATAGRVMRFTSGTTGAPKGVFLTHRNWLAVAHCTLLDRWNLVEGDFYLGTSPYAHAAGLWLLPALIRGAAVNVVDKFDPQFIFGEIKADRCNVLQLVPTGLRRLLDLPGVSPEHFTKLKAVSYGGAPIDAPTLSDALSIIGPKLVQGYGLNEAAIVCTLKQEDHHPEALGRAGWQQPLGREVAMAEVKIADADGRPVPDGEVGEIMIRGPMVLPNYWENPEATANAIRPDGYFRTGDLGMRGDNGIIYMAGRSKEIIVTGGYNVSPGEVEAVLLRHPGVHQCAVIGLPDREWGEQVTAFVVTKPGAAPGEAELIEHCRDHLTSYKKPKAIRFVEALPINSNGKVMRLTLREQVMREGEGVA